MLPLECPYLNKTALFTVVGQQVSVARAISSCSFYLHNSVDLVKQPETFHIEEEAEICRIAGRASAEVHRRSEQYEEESRPDRTAEVEGNPAQDD